MILFDFFCIIINLVVIFLFLFFFFFKQKTAYEITEGDWSSDVCSSDLVEECLEALESPLHLISLAPRLEVQGGIRLKRGAKRIEVPRGLELDADVREGVAPEYRHEGLNVGQHLALHVVPLVEVPDHAPVNPAHVALGAQLEAGERTHARVAGDELVQPWLEHASLGEVYLRSHGGHGGTRPDEREEHPGTGSAAVSLHDDDGLIPDEELAIAP